MTLFIIIIFGALTTANAVALWQDRKVNN